MCLCFSRIRKEWVRGRVAEGGGVVLISPLSALLSVRIRPQTLMKYFLNPMPSPLKSTYYLQAPSSLARLSQKSSKHQPNDPPLWAPGPRPSGFTETLPARASLVAQWLRTRLPTQGTQVPALVQEDPTCRGATKPVRQSY